MGGVHLRLPELKIGGRVAKVPIVQGGMAIRISTGRLAAAVAEEGGETDLAEEFGVMSIPTLVILKNGEKVAERLGFAPEPILKSWLESNL